MSTPTPPKSKNPTPSPSGGSATKDDPKADTWDRLSKTRPQDMNPAVADLTVRILDGFVGHMKQKHMNVKAQIEKDKKEIEWIDKEVAMLQRKHDAVTKHLDGATAERDRVKGQLDGSIGQMEQFMADSRKIIWSAKHMSGRLYSNVASQKLEEAQGFSRGASSTYRMPNRKPSPERKSRQHTYYV